MSDDRFIRILIIVMAAIVATFISSIFYIIVSVSTDHTVHVPSDNTYCYGRAPVGVTPNCNIGMRIGDSCIGIDLSDGSICPMP